MDGLLERMAFDPRTSAGKHGRESHISLYEASDSVGIFDVKVSATKNSSIWYIHCIPAADSNEGIDGLGAELRVSQVPDRMHL